MRSQPKTVLVTEDEVLTRADAVYFLIEAGYVVIEASHAANAIEILEKQALQVAVLFTDIHMPGTLNGLHLAHHVAHHWPWIGLLIVSGHAQPQAHDMPSRGHFLRKPYEQAAVLTHIGELITANDVI